MIDLQLLSESIVEHIGGRRQGHWSPGLSAVGPSLAARTSGVSARIIGYLIAPRSPSR
jgi:hypothetical protein